MSANLEEEKLEQARQSVAALTVQADALRAELLRLRRDLATVHRGFSDARANQLMEANEQLVLAALHADSVAEMARKSEGEMSATSQRDPLTGTANRVLMLDRIEHALALARRRRSLCAVLFLDLDRYKQINDTLGHATGDAVLRHAARRLESVVRESDSVSRFGGDEFVVLLTEVGEPSDAARIAAKMLDAVSAPSRIGEHALHLSASIGIAIFPRDAADTAGLISRADANMYRAKKNGGGSFAESQGAIGHAARK
jgi:diguanylate cyclase (GGDEF)-like protein